MYQFNTVVDYKKSEDDDLYRNQICEVFQLDEYNHEIIIKCIYVIHQKYFSNDSFSQLLKFAKIKFQEDDSIYAFMYLFSWDYFELLHTCLNDLNNTQLIAPENISCILNYEK